MLGNRYKERLVNAPNSLDSLLLNLPKQSSSTTQQHQYPCIQHHHLRQQLEVQSDNEQESDTAIKYAFHAMTTTNNVVTLPPAPTPALESNVASRHSSHQQQQRSSRLPSLGLIHGRILDQLPEHHLGMESSIGGFGTSLYSTENFSPSTSFRNETSLCDLPT